MMKYSYIRKFEDLRLEDVPLVGGKNASLGQMIHELSEEGVEVPHGFAVTAQGYWEYLESNNLVEEIERLLAKIDRANIESLQKNAQEIRSLFHQAQMPTAIEREIANAYTELCFEYKSKTCDVAVRSSATAEDLPNASFAGQQETFLNISGVENVIEACKRCMGSLFTDRAIIYREEKGFDHMKVALSVGVQKMIRSDLACSGVLFTLDTESGFKDAVMIEASYGLGDAIVKGIVTPDEYVVFKTTLLEGYRPIIKKKLGEKKIKIVYEQIKGDTFKAQTKEVPVTEKEQKEYVLTNDEILELARMGVTIERHYTQLKSAWSPMDIEWAKDGLDNKLYIIQARPETIHAVQQKSTVTTYRLLQQQEKLTILAKGLSIGQQIISGKARIIESIKQMNKIQEGDILITTMTDPDWVPIMKKAGGIITQLGGRTCHAAIVSRELETPAIVGAENAIESIKDGQMITLDCSKGTDGFIYQGEIPFEAEEIALQKVPEIPVDLMINLGNPEAAFAYSFLPVEGVGLARLEFIITNSIQIHPMALLNPDKITDEEVQSEIEAITAGYKDKSKFFIERLSMGIGMIAAAFYPRRVIVRLSDFKTNEYRNLIGGSYFEPEEANPMLGLRGASRYTHKLYKEAFALECAALNRVYKTMGLSNVVIMVPFVRTVEEGEQVLKLLAQHDIKKGENGIEIIMMTEVPSNVILVDEFSQIFDGFSIGSNDLTQLILGVDRDSPLLTELFDERDPAVKKMIIQAIEGAHRNDRYIGICGQAPSDFPEFADFLIEHKIDSISLNPDSVIPFLLRFSE